MNDRGEVIELVALMVRRWSHQRDLDSETAIENLEVELADVAIEHARAALDSWYRDGEKFAPTAGQLVGRIADLALDVPEWHVVKAALLRNDHGSASEQRTECPYGACEGTGIVLDWEENTGYPCRCRASRQAVRRARRAKRHPLIDEFLRLVGLGEVADIAGDRTAEAQVRQKWEAFTRGLRREVAYAGIEPAGLLALERISATNAARRVLGTGAPERPDYRGLVAGGDPA